MYVGAQRRAIDLNCGRHDGVVCPHVLQLLLEPHALCCPGLLWVCMSVREKRHTCNRHRHTGILNKPARRAVRCWSSGLIPASAPGTMSNARARERKRERERERERERVCVCEIVVEAVTPTYALGQLLGDALELFVDGCTLAACPSVGYTLAHLRGG
jgi:hypothetical protein